VDQDPGRTKLLSSFVFLLLLLFFITIIIRMFKHFNIDAKNMCFFVCRCFLLLCNISQIATGLPYSESPRKKSQIPLILIKIGCNLTCFGPVQSFDVLILNKDRWGSHVLRVLSKIHKKRWGTHVLRVLSKIELCALAPDFFLINFRLPYIGNILVVY
jgi:hypothetical protein